MAQHHKSNNNPSLLLFSNNNNNNNNKKTNSIIIIYINNNISLPFIFYTQLCGGFKRFFSFIRLGCRSNCTNIL